MSRILVTGIAAAAMAILACSGSPSPSTSSGSARAVTTTDITSADLRHRLFLITFPC